MSELPRSTGAVFLSYAREDADAARRIAEALRGFGVEVWFDLSELRGGDAWDAKIKKQIRECSLFIPIISAGTQAREEGYFRREWLLAVERKRDMTESRAFIVPVIVDDTREADADVPEQFLKAHCTRLPGGEPTPEFVAQVKRLLQTPRAVDTGTKPVTRASLPAATPPVKPGFPVVSVVLGGAVLALLAFVFLRPTAKSEPPPSAPAAATARKPEPTAATIAAADAKSIAVLPFVDMSQAKDQEYFSDGLSEELLNLLAKIPALHVTSRSSAFAFKGKSVELSEIAQRLHVAHILEGSVRKSGNKLRITAQLIDARTDTHLWSETYDRSLDDIFVVQDEIAAAVVGQLKISLLGDAPKAKAANPKAYAIFLQARQLYRQGTTDGLAQSVALSQQALEIDPSLAAARINLARCYMYQSNMGQRSNEQGYGQAREILEKTLTIDPASAEAHASLASVIQSLDTNLAPAARHFEQALALEPTNTEIMTDAMFFARSLGRPELVIKLGEYVVAHDPVNTTAHAGLGGAYARGGRYDEAVASLRTSLRLAPGRGLAHYTIGVVLLQKGDVAGALAEFQQEPAESWRLDGFTLANFALGKRAESDATLAELTRKYEREAAWNLGYIHAFRGEPDQAFEWLEKAIGYHDPGLSLTAVQWTFTNIQEDPRWLPFLRKIGRAPEQMAAVKFDVNLPGN